MLSKIIKLFETYIIFKILSSTYLYYILLNYLYNNNIILYGYNITLLPDKGSTPSNEKITLVIFIIEYYIWFDNHFCHWTKLFCRSTIRYNIIKCIIIINTYLINLSIISIRLKMAVHFM